MKKIMFADRFALTQAVLNGMKTQTRRIITPQPEYTDNGGVLWKGNLYGLSTSGPSDVEGAYRNFASTLNINKEYRGYRIGEIVAVAQNYTDAGVGVQKLSKLALQESPASASVNFLKKVAGFSNKMFVRADLMPHQIRITNLRVQRLQDITDEECAKEGIRVRKNKKPTFWDELTKDARIYLTPRAAYAELIDRISGRGTWESNPYVFVYDFELVK